MIYGFAGRGLDAAEQHIGVEKRLALAIDENLPSSIEQVVQNEHAGSIGREFRSRAGGEHIAKFVCRPFSLENLLAAVHSLADPGN